MLFSYLVSHLITSKKFSIPVGSKQFHFYIYLDMYIRYAFIKLYIYIYDNIRYTYINIYISNIFAVKKKKKKRPWGEKKKTFSAILQPKGSINFQNVYFSFSWWSCVPLIIIITYNVLYIFIEKKRNIFSLPVLWSQNYI